MPVSYTHLDVSKRQPLSHIGAPSLKGRIGPHPAFDGILVLSIHDHLFRKVSGAGRRTDVGQQTAALQPILIIHTALIPAVYMRDIIGIPRLPLSLIHIWSAAARVARSPVWAIFDMQSPAAMAASTS